jgi:hypothetical protein
LCYGVDTHMITRFPGGACLGEEDIVEATHMLGAGSRSHKHNYTVIQYIYDADVSRHRRHPEYRLRLGKSVVLWC